MRKEVYETGIPLNQFFVTYYDDMDKKTVVRAEKKYQGHVDWQAVTHYADFGENRLKSSTEFSSDYGNYTIKFDYYGDGSIKSVELSTDYGNIDLSYAPDGKLETLEKTVNGKKSTFNYTYAKDVELGEYSMLYAPNLRERFTSWYIDSTGGFSLFDRITDSESFADLQKEGVTVTTDEVKKQRKVERELTDKEKAAALALLPKHKEEKDEFKLYGKLEKLKCKYTPIGEDVKALDDNLIAVAKMYRHTLWERADGSTPCGNGEQWDYELEGAIVDIKKGEAISSVNFSSKVRDSYDGSLDTCGRITADMMIRVEGKTVEFYMGDKYNTIASKKVNTSQMSDRSNSSRTNNSGGYGDGR